MWEYYKWKSIRNVTLTGRTLVISQDARTAQLESPDFNSHTDLKLIQNLEHKK